jgi:chemotaxis response regulator CheB
MTPCFFKLQFFKIPVLFVLSTSVLTLNEEQVSSILELSSAVRTAEKKLGHELDIANPNTIENDNILKKIQNINESLQQSLNSRVVENADRPHTDQIKQGEYQKTNSENSGIDEIKIVDIKRGGIEGGAIIEK